MPSNLIEELPARLEKALSGVLQPNETVHVKLKGAFKEGLVCTETRVIIVKGGFMTNQMLGTDVFQQPYSNIAGVQIKKHWTTGYLEVNAGGMQNTPKSYWSNQAGSDAKRAPNCVSLLSQQFSRFQEASNFIMQRISTPTSPPSGTIEAGQASVADEIAKLAQLRDAGVLTEEEFTAQKTRLLAQS